MKRALCVVILVALALQPSSTLGQQVPAKRPEAVPIEDLLPAETLVFAATAQLAALISGVRRLDAYRVTEARLARLPKPEREGKGSMLAEAMRFVSFGLQGESVLDETRLGFALVRPAAQPPAAPGGEPPKAQPKPPAAQPADKAAFQEPDFVAFVEAGSPEAAAKARAEFIAYYSETFEDLGTPDQIKRVRHLGATVERFKNGYAGTMVGTTYVLGDWGAIAGILAQRSKSDLPRLADDLDFARARAELGAHGTVFAYLSGAAWAQYLGENLAKGAGSLTEPLSAALKEPIRSVALASRFEREGVVDRLVLALEPGRAGLLATLFSGPAAAFGAAAYVPAGTQVLISQSLDLGRVFDEFLAPLVFGGIARAEAPRAEISAGNKAEPQLGGEASASQIKALVARYEEEIGFKFRGEIEKDFGQEVSLAMGLPAARAIPGVDGERMALFVALRDRDAARAAVDKLIGYVLRSMAAGAAKQDRDAEVKPEVKEDRERAAAEAEALLASMPRETYKEAEIVTIFGAAAMGWLKDYLVVAESSETIKQLIDTPENGAPLTLDDRYRRAMSGSPNAANSKVYIAPQYFEEMLDQLQRAWVARMPPEAGPAALSVPATLAAYAESDERTIRLEAFSPIGIPGMLGVSLLGDRLYSRASANEAQAVHHLRRIAEAEKAFAAKHAGRYATLDEIAAAKPTDFDVLPLKGVAQGYRFEVKLKAKAAGFEATATPAQYGRGGRYSFFVDETGKFRRADRNGEPATAADEPLPQAEKQGN